MALQKQEDLEEERWGGGEGMVCLKNLSVYRIDIQLLFASWWNWGSEKLTGDIRACFCADGSAQG